MLASEMASGTTFKKPVKKLSIMKKTNWNISPRAKARAERFGMDEYALDAMISETGLGCNAILKVLETANKSGHIAPAEKPWEQTTEVIVGGFTSYEARSAIKSLFYAAYLGQGTNQTEGVYKFEDYAIAGMFYREAAELASDTITMRIKKNNINAL